MQWYTQGISETLFSVQILSVSTSLNLTLFTYQKYTNPILGFLLCFFRKYFQKIKTEIHRLTSG
jgi:hypothetical protein